MAQWQQGQSRAQIAAAMLGSPEEAQLYPDASADAFLNHLYATILNRAPDAPGRQFWKDLMAGSPPMPRATVALNIIDAIASSTAADASTLASKAWFNNKVAAALTQAAAAAQAATADSAALASKEMAASLAAAAAEAAAADAPFALTPALYRTTQLTQLYALMFNRKPDLDGLTLQLAQMDKGSSLADLAQAFTASDEWQALVQADPGATGILTRIWNNALGRAPTAGELSAWGARLNADPNRQGAVYVDLLQSVLAGGDGSAAAQISSTLLRNQVALNLNLLAAEAAQRHADLQRQAAVAKATAQAAAAIARLTLAEPAVLLKPGMAGALTNGLQARLLPVVQRRYDRWGNVVEVTDARNPAWKTTYTYNANNQLLSEQKPGDADGPASVTRVYYDALGRQAAVRDANGNVNGLRYDARGNVAEEVHADGGRVNYTYDLFGDRLQQSILLKDGSARLTDYAYDHLGHLVQTASGEVAVWESEVTLRPFVSVDTTVRQRGMQRLVDRYAYDELGRQVAHVNAAGDVSRNVYDLRGNIVASRDSAGVLTTRRYDAFDRQTGETDGNGYTMSWRYENGRLVSHTDLGGATHAYSYNRLNQMTLHTSAGGSNGGGVNIATTYDPDSGLLMRIDDRENHSVTTYSYDLAGHRVAEKTAFTDPADGRVTVAQDNHLRWDAQGRLAAIADSRYDVRYEYDANGNRTRVLSGYIDDDGIARVTDNRSAYDAMNRQTLADGTADAGGQVIAGERGHRIAYDYDGSRLSDTYAGRRLVASDSPWGTVWRTVDGQTSERYSYDAAGRLTGISRDGINIDRRGYDAAGRLVVSGIDIPNLSGNLAGALSDAGVTLERRLQGYDSRGRQQTQLVLDADGKRKVDVRFGDWDDQGRYVAHYDDAGNLTRYVVAPQGMREQVHDLTYARYEGYRQDSISTFNVEDPGGKVVSRLTLDGSGNVVRAEDGQHVRTYLNDAAGRVLQKTEDGVVTHTLIADGEVFGSSGDALPAEGFNSSYVPATAAALAAGPGSYTVRAGDTLQGIARAVWGDADLWYLIADANGGIGNGELAAGQVITLPARGNTLHNDFATFKPYSAGEAMGDVTPNLPVPADDGGGCGGIGQIVTIVVAIVLSYFAPWGSSIWAEMAYGATASAAGQGAAIAAGEQDEFSWRGVAMSAISAGVASGLSSWMPTSNVTANMAMRAAVGNALTQGVGVATGLQDSFSWRSVAASAAGAGMGQAVGQGLRGTEFAKAFGKIGVGAASSFAGGMAAAVLRGGRLSVQQVAIDAFGNAALFGVRNCLNFPHSPSFFEEGETVFKQKQSARCSNSHQFRCLAALPA